MRHIFHRVVVRIMSLFEQCFKDEDKNTEFETLVNPYLLKLASLRLDWLHVKPLSKTMWLAKDELGLSRIIAFMYQQFFLNMKSRETANMFKNSLAALRQLLNSLQIVTALLNVSTQTSRGGHGQAHRSISVALPLVLSALLCR